MASSHPQGTISQDQVEYDGGPWHTLDESRIAWISACEEELNQLEKDGFPGYYHCMAPVYALLPDQFAKGQWLKGLVEKHADFIGIRKGGIDVKLLDYAAGTGFLSHLAVDFFGCAEQLKIGLAEPIRCLKQGGTILIIDIEKSISPGDDGALLDGRKSTGNSSQDVATALEGWGIEDIEVKHERFRFELMKGTICSRDEVYFVLRAKKGERLCELLKEDAQRT